MAPRPAMFKLSGNQGTKEKEVFRREIQRVLAEYIWFSIMTAKWQSGVIDGRTERSPGVPSFEVDLRRDWRVPRAGTLDWLAAIRERNGIRRAVVVLLLRVRGRLGEPARPVPFAGAAHTQEIPLPGRLKRSPSRVIWLRLKRHACRVVPHAGEPALHTVLV
ncbi:hypothetical protein SKAU_G00334570 [Synaphobranchus kaupii]|uniref:Uncharacterized protein n=1 Tax=Synaphobranchus kaupii TaxID=118154 RepID=A0A9Q1ELV1_SYNKA|nr:hypothetical protein SKAU_G00334570 [Synaphobranchus kaupii]